MGAGRYTGYHTATEGAFTKTKLVLCGCGGRFHVLVALRRFRLVVAEWVSGVNGSTMVSKADGEGSIPSWPAMMMD